MSCDCGAFSGKLNRILNLVQGQSKRISTLENRVASLEREVEKLGGDVNSLEEKDKRFVDRVFEGLRGRKSALALIIGGLTIGGIQVGPGLKEATRWRGAIENLSSEVGGKISRVQKTIDATKADIVIENGKVKSIAERANRKANSAISTAGAASSTAAAASATALSAKVIALGLAATVATLLPVLSLANELRRAINNLYEAIYRGDDLTQRLILSIQARLLARIQELERRGYMTSQEAQRIISAIQKIKPCPAPQVVRVNVPVPVDRPYPVTVRQPYPVDRPYPVTVRQPYPVDRPYPVTVRQPYPVDRPYPVTVRQPYPVDRPYPVTVRQPYPVDRPYPLRVTDTRVIPVTNTITRTEKVPVPTPFPVTNTVTRIVPQIVQVPTIKCPDPCPPPSEPGEIEFPTVAGGWVDGGCGLDSPPALYQYSGTGFFGVASAIEQVGRQLADLKQDLCPWLITPKNTIEVVSCDPALPPETTIIENLKGANYLEKINDQLFAYLKDIKGSICGIDPIAAVPEHWQVRIGANRPQLIVHYAELDETTGKPKKGGGRYPMSIPHWNGSTNWALLPRWRKGSVQGRAVLADNSRIIIYAVNEAEAKIALTKILGFVSGGVKDGAKTYFGKVNQSVKVFKAIPINARYFERGQLTEIPEFFQIYKG